ncbi:adenosine deaminase cecr1 [Plakobranchus ocellatus]|uniref:adenosine deaminase n=1 Tax=Plakobranchus ocellatus TaxID=259542 RepID=A0AAV4CPK1_9GAST|nr:adenosine deaminase cecr1 [Plakobranchus ocellatus]
MVFVGVGASLLVVTALVATAVVLTVEKSDAAPVRGYTKDEYMKARALLLSKDLGRALGAGQVMNSFEKALDAILLKEKKTIIERARLDRKFYMPARSFFISKPWMENTTTFKIIKEMPKGAALHLHEPAIASLRWLVKNITYRKHVYMCRDRDNFTHLNMFLQTPKSNPNCPWLLVSTERAAAKSPADFDEEMIISLSFLRDKDPLKAFPGVNAAWDRFNKYFDQVIPLFIYVPVLKDYISQAMQEFYDDNVQYMEIRGSMLGYQSLNGTQHDAEFGVNLFKQVSEDFVKSHPDFLGAKVIMSGLRFKPSDEISKEIKIAMALRQKYPNFFLGYDLVAQEDPLNPLLFYLDALLEPTLGPSSHKVPYFFHTAETKWQGTVVDENLIDALLLNTTRIGHGYGLAKHPELADQVKKRGIAVEVNPISNQLLGLVSDLRNHPMTNLFADDFPLIISSDDPATWEALPLTHDFFLAFMDMSGEDMGIAFLKQLAINSIKYSAMNETEKKAATALWQSKWDTFVKDAVNKFSVP